MCMPGEMRKGRDRGSRQSEMMYGACQSFRELRATSPHRARAAVGWKGRASHVTGHELQHDGGDDGRREHGVVPAGGQGQWSGVRHSGTGRLVQA